MVCAGTLPERYHLAITGRDANLAAAARMSHATASGSAGTTSAAHRIDRQRRRRSPARDPERDEWQ
jgi:hypothetical protein